MAFGSAAAVLSLALAAATPAPIQTDSLFTVAWRRTLVEPYLLEYKPIEPAGPAVDPLTGMVVAATRDGFVQAYSAEGKDLWYAQLPGPYLAPPTVADGLAIVSGLDGRIFAFDAARGDFRWMYTYREEFGSRPVVAGDLAYFVTLEGTGPTSPLAGRAAGRLCAHLEMRTAASRTTIRAKRRIFPRTRDRTA